MPPVMEIIRDGKTYFEFFSPHLDDYELMEKQLTWGAIRFLGSMLLN